MRVIRGPVSSVEAAVSAAIHSRFGGHSLVTTDFAKSFDRTEVLLVIESVRLRTLATILAFVVISGVFLLGQTPSGAETGIEGVITVSPAQPGPTRADAPGSIPLANTAFMVENQNGEVASFTTDDQGHFRIPLVPGHHKVSIKGRKSSIGHFGPFEVDVAPGKMTKVQWECDSGIR
jgi:hypothetical protein